MRLKALTSGPLLYLALVASEAQLPSRPVIARTARHSGGTVNIILANPQGLVAVTDSRLSSFGQPIGRGTKLFRLDDHTICTIAGWYSSSGPEVNGTLFPMYSAIPVVLNHFASGPNGLSSFSLAQKVELVTDAVQFTLDHINVVAQATQEPPDLEPSQITIATFEAGKLQIARTSITPIAERGKTNLKIDVGRTQIVMDKLVYSAAGMSTTAETYLSLQKTELGDPIMSNYYQSMVKDHGATLSLGDMEQIAKRLARLTEQAFPAVVGEPLQIATIDRGTAKFVQKPDFPLESRASPFASLMNWVDGISIGGSETHYGGGVAVKGAAEYGGGAVLITNGHFEYCRQDLDYIFIFNSVFKHCRLTYSGSPIFVFDKSNEVQDSTLEIPRGLGSDSAAVRAIREAFPQLKIVVQGK
jgi:hypothetical protein